MCAFIGSFLYHDLTVQNKVHFFRIFLMQSTNFQHTLHVFDKSLAVSHTFVYIPSHTEKQNVKGFNHRHINRTTWQLLKW